MSDDYYEEEHSARVAAWLEVTRSTDLVTFFLSTTINGILLNLINTESPKHFGNYVYLMMSFSINSLIFAAIHAFIQPFRFPSRLYSLEATAKTKHESEDLIREKRKKRFQIISTEKYVVFVFTSTNYLELPRRFMGGLLAIYGTSYSQTLVFTAVQFIYRYFSISRRTYLYYFKGKFLVMWFLMVAAFGINWGLCIFFIAKETQEVDEVLSPVMMSSYNLNMSEVYYVAASYEIEDQLGNKELNWKCLFMVINFACILGISLGIIILCVIAIHWKMQRSNYSAIYEAVQKQLFRALISQMIIPFLLIYLPIICVLILPLFHFKNDASMSLTSILISLYPVLDPFAVIMIVSVYREGFLNMFSSKPKNRVAHMEGSLHSGEN